MFWGRRLELMVGQAGNFQLVVNQDFRVIFSIMKNATKDPNQGRVRVYNANESSRKQMHASNAKCMLRAGYDGEAGMITMFIGDILHAITYIDGTDTITELTLGDGFVELRDTVISVSFKPDTSAITILTLIASKMGLVLKPIPEIQARTYPSGFSFVGQAYKALDKVCNYLGVEWSIQNNELQILVNGGVVEQRAILLSSDTGMIGSPESEEKTFSEKRAYERGYTKGENVVTIIEEKNGKQKKKYKVFGYNVSSYLMPHIQPGSKVKVDARYTKGLFRVEKVEHFGDTYGAEFRTDMVLRTLKNG